MQEVRSLGNGAFAGTDFGELTHVLYNSKIGFAEADKALKAVVEAALEKGVKFKVGTVDKLNFDRSGQVTGVGLLSGEKLVADKTLLATGARTANILFRSAPTNKLLHAGDRLAAKGSMSFTVTVCGDQREKLTGMPVIINSLPAVEGSCHLNYLWLCL